MKEVWKPVLSWEGLYEVSSLGKVRSVSRYRKAGFLGERWYPSVVLKQYEAGSKGTYLYVALRDKANKRQRSAAVHILVCEAFHGPRPEGYHAGHGNRGKYCNHADNLSWQTPEDNLLEKLERLGQRRKITEFTHQEALRLLDGSL